MEIDIAAANRKRPHLVIVGAGATIATIPNGDKNGKKASVMNDFIKQIGLEDLFEGVKLETQSNNFRFASNSRKKIH